MGAQENHGKLFYDTGKLHYEGGLKDVIPLREGIKYYKNGMKHMVGLFEDWFISSGREYYENGNLKFEGKYKSGPRQYYGLRFFHEGKLVFEPVNCGMKELLKSKNMEVWVILCLKEQHRSLEELSTTSKG
ncbi:hypothetical protein ACFPES_31015 [Paenibacillus sp. GCM10023248]|uniref:hypothetical protein n=1 Tax=unclassified Paenibacillus TaxID=185978 RepID=UPI002378113B|nr:hypothetical protein [Paenibacillus sp. MAHUQ-63]MDD9271476.1 hypothetical protein [Paenibacillus sp. MAHUQ-63]